MAAATAATPPGGPVAATVFEAVDQFASDGLRTRDYTQALDWTMKRELEVRCVGLRWFALVACMCRSSVHSLEVCFTV